MRTLFSVSTIALFFAVGCSTAPSPSTPAPASMPVVAAAETPAFPIASPTAFVRDIGVSEAAVVAVQKTLAKSMCTALQSGSADMLLSTLKRDARGRLGHDEVDAVGFARGLVGQVRAWQVLERCSLKVHGFRLAPDGKTAWSRLELQLAGRVADRPVTARGWMTAALVADPWRASRVDLPPLTQQHTDAQPFTDVSRQTGVGLPIDQTADRALASLRNNTLIETIGGLAVIDWNADGRDDLLAWHRRRVLALFENDGQGGFARRIDLVPPAGVGLFQLIVDLDGDGAVEVLSTELTGCTAGRRQMTIYRAGPKALPVAGRLEFDGDCTHHRDVTYQHIAAADVDADGDLDLFVSGYGNRETNQGGYNKFDTQRGQRNLLFINQGGLRFDEVGAQRGIAGTRFSYGATFFDFEGDGDSDLYVVNDYGPNALYLNKDGHFTAKTDTALTRHGQSMGVTVADFDGDLDLDVYVSNMYSKAGHRIVDLADDRLSPTTHRQLTALALGNALYTQTSPGEYTETAQVAGLNRAGWAWGQAWFDHDNDGDRDLYAVNGMTSHDQIREHDY